MSGQYQIAFLPSAVRELRAIPRAAQVQIAVLIDALAQEPRPTGAKLLAGTGSARIWRHRGGAHRALYEVTDERLLILIVRVADRREAYRSPEMTALLKRIRQSHG